MYHQRFKTADQRFDEKFTVDPCGCWLWRSGKEARHPGSRLDGQHLKASHFAWERANGRKLLACEQVLHTCDRPRCVNPAHLFIGDHTANMRDRSQKGRGNHPSGARNGRARITRFIADEIRRLYAAGGISQQKLADKFGLGQVTVSYIVRNVTWRDRK